MNDDSEKFGNDVIPGSSPGIKLGGGPWELMTLTKSIPQIFFSLDQILSLISQHYNINGDKGRVHASLQMFLIDYYNERVSKTGTFEEEETKLLEKNNVNT